MSKDIKKLMAVVAELAKSATPYAPGFQLVHAEHGTWDEAHYCKSCADAVAKHLAGGPAPENYNEDFEQFNPDAWAPCEPGQVTVIALGEDTVADHLIRCEVCGDNLQCKLAGDVVAIDNEIDRIENIGMSTPDESLDMLNVIRALEQWNKKDKPMWQQNTHERNVGRVYAIVAQSLIDLICRQEEEKPGAIADAMQRLTGWETRQ